MEPVTRSRSRRRDACLYFAGFITGCFLIAATCIGNAIYSYSRTDTREDFLTTIKGYVPWYQDEIRLELQSLLGVELPDSTLVMSKESSGIDEKWLSMVFQTSEAHANELTASLDERYPIMGAEELAGMKSFGEGGVMTPPVRAWRLPKESQVQTLVVRLVRISDSKAIWVVEDHLKN